MQFESDLQINDETQQTQVISPRKHHKRNGNFNNTVILPKDTNLNDQQKGQSTILYEELMGDDLRGSDESFSLYSGIEIENQIMEEIENDNETKNILENENKENITNVNINKEEKENNSNNTSFLNDNTSLLEDRSTIPEELKRMGTFTTIGQTSFEHFSRISLPKSTLILENEEELNNDNNKDINEIKQIKKQQKQIQNINEIKKIAQQSENSDITETTQSSKPQETSKKPTPQIFMNQSNMNETELLKMYINHFLETSPNDKSIAMNSLVTLVNEVAKENNINSSINISFNNNNYNYNNYNDNKQEQIYMKTTHEITSDKTQQKRIFCEMIEEEKETEIILQTPRQFLKEYEKERIEFPIDPPTVQTPPLFEDMEDEEDEHPERQLTNPDLRNDEYFHLKEHCNFVDFISIVPLQSQVNWKPIELINNDENIKNDEINQNEIHVENELVLMSRLFFGSKDDFVEEYASASNEKMKIVQ